MVETLHFWEDMMTYSCPVCGQSTSTIILKRVNVPVYQNQLFETKQRALDAPRGDLSVALCNNCGFIFNGEFNPALLAYNEQYENTQTYSAMFEKYLDACVDYLIQEKGVKNCHVIEIGCGKGHFLRKLVERGNNYGIGFDPSYIGPLDSGNDKLRFQRSLYDENSAGFVADTILCRHVIEHIQYPISLLTATRRALINSPHAQVFFETPDVEWILRNQVVWDFFYEHCSYFNKAAIHFAFEKAGFRINRIQARFGDQYFWIEARPESELNKRPFANNNDFLKTARQFAEANQQLTDLWKTRLSDLAEKKPVALWGAGAKGVTFANLFDPDRKWIACVIDINPQKQNKFLPGTGHPIVHHRELSKRNIKSVIVLNPNYLNEIYHIIQQTGLDGVQLHEFVSGEEYAHNH